MLQSKKQSGFSLIEVLIASMLIFGLIYLYFSSSQSQAHQVDSRINGKYLSVLFNDMIVDIAMNNSKCTVSGSAQAEKLLDCYDIHPDVQNYLAKMGFDLSESIVDLHQANTLSVTLISKHSFNSDAMYVMANEVMSNLSARSFSCLNAGNGVPFSNQTGDTNNFILVFNLQPGCGA